MGWREWRARIGVWFGVFAARWFGRGQWRRGRVVLPGAGFLPGWTGGGAWRWGLYVPPRLGDAEAAPLVVLLHGCGQRALPFAHAAGWTRAARRHRFRLLCPQQRRGANAHGCWNWFHPRAQAGRGELDAVLAAIDAVAAQVTVSTVSTVGLSAGGAMSALLAFHHAERLAAAVAVAAPPLLGPLNLQDPRAVMRQGLLAPTLAVMGLARCAPLLVLHGDADDVVSPRCAAQLAAQAIAVQQRGGAVLVPEPGGEDHRAEGRLLLRVQHLPGAGHAWTGARGGHAHVTPDGPAMTALALRFLRDSGAFAPA